jgi:hypothetical protein
MRLSLKESRMKLLNATNLDRKSGIRGPKTMGEAHHSFSCWSITTPPFVICHLDRSQWRNLRFSPKSKEPLFPGALANTKP